MAGRLSPPIAPAHAPPAVATDDPAFREILASEERYHRLIHFLPIALWQVDASCMKPIFDELRAGGVSDLDAYLDDHPELIEFANDNVMVREVNRSAMLLFGGIAPVDFVRPVRYLFSASPETPRRIMVARFDGKRNHAEIARVRTFDGRLLDVQLSVTYPAPPEQLDVTIISLEDITERRRTEAQLRQLQADFAHAARLSMLGELTTSIAHEVAQPLAAILTNAESSLRWLVRDAPDHERVEQLLERIAGSARRATEIIGRIRGMAANRAPEPVPLDLNETVEEALLFIHHEIESRAVEIEVGYAAGLPRALGDRVQLQQVVVNLIVNAAQAIAQAGSAVRRIAIRTEAEGASLVAVSVRDSGPGIAPEHLGRLFDGFFTTKAQGLGIGLAICQSIVDAHGGGISASNDPGGGAHFRFTVRAEPGRGLSSRRPAPGGTGRDSPRA